MRTVAIVVLVVVATMGSALASNGEGLRPRYFFGMGLVVRKAPSELGNLGGLRHADYVARTTGPQEAHFEHDAGLRWRVGLGFGPAVFVAIDTGLGVTALPTGPQMAAPLRTGSAATLLGVAGLRGQFDRSTLGVELGGGFRHFTYCIGESVERHDVYTGFQQVVEVRVRGERWLGSSAVLGATLGTSLIDRGSWVGSLDVTFHVRGRRPNR